MATRAKAIKKPARKKPAIGNTSSDAAIQQEPVIVVEQEQNAISGLKPQGRMPMPRVAGTKKRRKRQPKSKSIFQQPLLLVGAGIALIYIVGSLKNSSSSESMEKSMLPTPSDEFAESGEMNSEITGWHRPLL
jgi:hypothetical protein